MQIQIKVPDEVVALAQKAGLQTEDYVERLLGQIAASRSTTADAKTQLRDDLLSDWNHFQETGLHITGDEVDAWLETLSLSPSAEPPTLHR